MNNQFSVSYPERMHAKLLGIAQDHSYNFGYIAKLLKSIDPSDCCGKIVPCAVPNRYVVSSDLDSFVEDSTEARVQNSADRTCYLVAVFDDHYGFDWLSDGSAEGEEVEGDFDRNEDAIVFYALSKLLEYSRKSLDLEVLQEALTEAEFWFMRIAIRAEA